MADVSTPNAAYNAAAPSWRLIRDACAGEATIKAAGFEYLCRPNPGDKSQAAVERANQYLKRAVWYGATGRTVDGLLGLAFQKEPKIEVPSAVKPILENIDGGGQTVVQHMHESLGQVISQGRAGLLTDFPKKSGQVSKADERTLGLRPTITYYDALSIINWRTVTIGGETRLSMIVLHEIATEFSGFEESLEPQYRVLELVDGKYRVQIWREDKNATGIAGKKWVVVDTIFPTNGAGNPLTEIPFTFIGSKNNAPPVDKAPMLDIASLNVAHYRNSADYEDSVYFCGQPQFWMSGLDENWVKMLEEKGVYMGSRSILPLPVGGAAGILQAAPNTLAKEAMSAKEAQMAALGARLIQADKSLKTATQQQSEDAVANSVLGICADNTSAAYQTAFTWAASFGNTAGKVEVAIPKDFTQFTIAPDELAQLIQGVQSALIPQSDFWRRMRAAGVIDPKKTDDEIREEIDQNPPLGLGADPGAEDPNGNATSDQPPAE